MTTNLKKMSARCMAILFGMLSIAAAQPSDLAVLRSLVSDSALPAISQVAETAAQLKTDVAELCENPTESALTKSQAAWTEAYLAWRRAEPFLFGSAKKMDRYIGKWPANAIVLNAATESARLNHMLNAADSHGYAAIEELLFSPKSAASATTAGRCAHLKMITAEVAELTAKMQADWIADYAEQFMAAGDGNPYLLATDALAIIYSELLNVTERSLRYRIGAPCGYFRGPVKPENLEAWTSKNTISGYRATLAGIRLVMQAHSEAGIVDLVATRDGLVEKKNPALAAQITKQLAAMEKSLDRLAENAEPIELAITAKPKTLKPLYKQFQTLQDQLLEASLVLEIDVQQGQRNMTTKAAAK